MESRRLTLLRVFSLAQEMTRREILNFALNASPDAIKRTLFESVRADFPGWQIVEPYGIDIERFAFKNDLPFTNIEESGTDLQMWEQRGQVYSRSFNGWHLLEWEDETYELIVLTTKGSYSEDRDVFLIGKSHEALKRLVSAVAEWSRKDRGAVLTFEGGCWSTSEDLLEAVQSTRFDSLVLGGELKEQLKGDISSWLAARETYEKYGIPWKRGIILVGDPGNGKTHAVKAIANEFDLRVLYVRSFSSERNSDQENIAKVFAKARETAPCLLVLEDLDTLVTSQNRSFLLNEMDGFASNAGILTIGTANNPEKLDPALAERPSRFDRRYYFSRPAFSERERYLQLFTDRLEPALQLGDSAAEVAEVTDGYSFAYLKELVLSGMMAWISGGGEGRFADALLDQTEALGIQMQNEPPPVAPAPMHRYPRSFSTDDDEDDD
ncbi:ATP-binding protein [bacterium]|nr:MAG: ATP-binding protein [bacterium]